jgi:hypothetical protein
VNDVPDQDSPELAAVRRLLADARHDEPMPDDVAARLERVIARLGDENPAATPEPPASAVVVPIAAHRRRRAGALLVAAAAIVVGGVAAGQLVHPSSSSDSRAASRAQDFSSTGDSNGGPALSGGQSPPTTSKTPDAQRLRNGVVVVRPKHFALDALQARSLLQREKSNSPTRFATLRDCGALAKRGRALPAEYQRAPAALLFRRPEGDTQVVDLFVCGSSQPIKTATLPAP